MRHGLRHSRVRLLLAAMAMASTAACALAGGDDPLAGGKERHLGGHGFLPSIYVHDPFVGSCFRNHTGAGTAFDLTTVFRDLQGSPLFILKGNVLFASLGVGYQQKLGAKWAVGTKVWTTRIEGTWAYAFSPGLGVRVDGAFGLYEVPQTQGVSKGSHRLGLLGEYDLKHGRSNLPLGFSLGYTQALPDNDPFTGMSGILLGI